MKKNALIMASRSVEITPLEEALLATGFDALRVGTLRDALQRLDTENFVVLICADDELGQLQRDLVKALSTRPFGLITPVVLLGPGQEPTERSALTSLLDQYFPLDTDPQLLAEFCDEVSAMRSEKAKRGRLQAITVPQLLQQAASFKLDGSIVLEREEEKAILYVEQGFIVFASSNRDENRFGEFLVQQGIITREEFSRAARRLHESGKRIGNILVEEGILKPQVLQTLIQSQVKHIIYAVFDWIDGEYYILLHEKGSQQDSVARFDVPSLILEGVRYKFDEQRLEKELSPLERRVSLAVSLPEAQKLVHLGSHEIDFLRNIGTGRPLNELLNLNSFGRVESLRLLFAFRILGFVVLEEAAVPVTEQVAKHTERAKVVKELFSPKGQASTSAPTIPASTKPKPKKVKRRRKGFAAGWWAGAFATAAAMIFFTIVTFVNPRSSREGNSLDVHELQPLDLDPPEVAETIPSPPREVAPPPPEPTEEPISPVVLAEREMQEATPVPTAPPAVKTPPPPTPTPRPVVKKAKPKPKPQIRKRKKPVRVARVTPKKSADEKLQDQFTKLYRMAEQQQKTGQLQAAFETYRKAFRINPTHVDTVFGMADVLFELGKTKNARRFYQRASILDPYNPRPYLSLGTVYMIDGDRKRAIRSYKKYLQLVKKTPENQHRVSEVQKVLQSLQAVR